MVVAMPVSVPMPVAMIMPVAVIAAVPAAVVASLPAAVIALPAPVIALPTPMIALEAPMVALKAAVVALETGVTALGASALRASTVVVSETGCRDADTESSDQTGETNEILHERGVILVTESTALSSNDFRPVWHLWQVVLIFAPIRRGLAVHLSG